MNRSATMLLILTIFSCESLAQVCPYGAYPGRLDEPQICLPPPDEDVQPQTSRARWETRWGAIATDDTKGIIGAVKNAKNKRSANKAALQQCKLNGGGKKCALTLTYFNQCSAVAWGDTSRAAAGRAGTDFAAEAAMKTCHTRTTNCKIVYSACSLAERVH